MYEYSKGWTDETTTYQLVVTVVDYPQENARQRGTLLELSEEWPIVRMLITRPEGGIDDGMLSEPIFMNLTIGLANYKLYPVEE